MTLAEVRKERQPGETGTRRRKSNPGDALLRVKRSLDGVIEALGGHPDLKSSATELRDKVLDAFLCEERKGPA